MKSLLRKVAVITAIIGLILFFTAGALAQPPTPTPTPTPTRTPTGIELTPATATNPVSTTQTVNKASTLTVTSPNGGEEWQANGIHKITWTYSNIRDDVLVEIKLSRNGVNGPWEVIWPHECYVSWILSLQIPGPATKEARIKVETVDGTISDISDNNFTILPGLSVTLFPPGDIHMYVGATHTVTALVTFGTDPVAGAEVKFDVHGVHPNSDEKVTDSEGKASLSWTGTQPGFDGVFVNVKAGENRALALQLVIWEKASLSVTSPNGGENWAVGSTQTITWDSVGVPGKVRIELSRNGGHTWEKIISSTPNDGSQAWKVTGPATYQARIKVVSISYPKVLDISDANFTIVQSMTVTSPNGGEKWLVGTRQTITWSSVGAGRRQYDHIRIQLSRNGGSTWKNIISSTPNDGSQAWKVTGPITTQAKIRVVSLANPKVFDISDANFTISP